MTNLKYDLKHYALIQEDHGNQHELTFPWRPGFDGVDYSILLPQELVEHQLHVLPVGLDSLAALVSQTDQDARDAVDKLIPPKALFAWKPCSLPRWP